MKRIYLDTNIFIDVLLDRHSDDISIRKLAPYLEKSQVFMSTLSVHITYYTLKIKQGSSIHNKTTNLLDTINLIPLTLKEVNLSLYTFSKDFEDTLQYYSALEYDCDYIFTRDTKDFTHIKKKIPSDIQIIDTLENIHI